MPRLLSSWAMLRAVSLRARTAPPTFKASRAPKAAAFSPPLRGSRGGMAKPDRWPGGSLVSRTQDGYSETGTVNSSSKVSKRPIDRDFESFCDRREVLTCFTFEI